MKMKTCMTTFLRALTIAALLIASNTYAQSQNFSWTVTGTGTETWYTENVTYSTKGASTSEAFNPTDTEYITAGASGQATYSVSINGGPMGWSSASIYYGNTAIFSASVGNTDKTEHYSGSFAAVAGQTYTLKASISALPGASSGVQVWVPKSIQTITNTATRTGTATGSNFVRPSDGQKNLYGFSSSAIPQPQNGGTMSGISYSLTWNNPNVALVFSDTWSTTTANPNAYIIAIWLPSVQGLAVVQTNLNSIVFEVSPGLSTNYSIGGYCVGNAVTNYFGTGPGPTYFTAESLHPNTSYTFYISEWDWVNEVGGPVLVTNVTTLPEPSVQGLSVVQTNLNSVVFGISPGLSTNYSIGGYCVGNGVTNSFGTPPGPTSWQVNSLRPNTSYTFYISEWDFVNNASGPVVVTNVTTLPVPTPTVISITPGLTNAVVVCTNIFPGGGAGWMIMTNGVPIPSLAGATGANPYTSASVPFSFGIGNGSVPGVSCFEPGTVYQVAILGWLNGMWSAYVTNTFTTLEPAGYHFLSGQLLGGGKIRLSFAGDAGAKYALECSSGLAPANWIPVFTNSADSFGTLILTNTVSTTGNIFWRVRAVQ